jgi:hypothetical protein
MRLTSPNTERILLFTDFSSEKHGSAGKLVKVIVILGRPRRRWEDNIKMDLQEVGRGCGDWIELAQDRDRWRALVSTVMNCGVT